jgi:hypothetical protein
MAQQRQHTAPPPAGEDTLASLPEPPALATLLDTVRSPGVVKADVEALLAAMALPPGGAETPRERADVLLSLLEARSEAGDLTDARGRTVREAAMEALLALGYPYALELPPEVLERMGRGKPTPSPSRLGLAITGIAALLHAVMAVVTFVSFQGAVGEALGGAGGSIFALLLAGLMLTPSVLAIAGNLRGSGPMQGLGSKLLAIQGAGWVWLAVAIMDYGKNMIALPVGLLLPWHVTLLAAFLMRHRPEPGAPALPPAGEP